MATTSQLVSCVQLSEINAHFSVNTPFFYQWNVCLSRKQAFESQRSSKCNKPNVNKKVCEHYKTDLNTAAGGTEWKCLFCNKTTCLGFEQGSCAFIQLQCGCLHVCLFCLLYDGLQWQNYILYQLREFYRQSMAPIDKYLYAYSRLLKHKCLTLDQFDWGEMRHYFCSRRQKCSF